MLNKRSVEILMNLLYIDPVISLERLSAKYDLSKRSIRYDIDNINFFLKVNGFNELKKCSKGTYQLDESIKNFSEIKKLIKNKYYIFSPSERLDYIKANFYFMKEPLKLNSLEKELSVSNSTVRVDLNEVKAYFEKADLKIDYQPKRGFILSGDEETLRKSALKFLLKYIKVSGTEITYKEDLFPTLGTDLIFSKILQYFENISVREVANFIKKTTLSLKISMSDEADNTLKLYMLYLIRRVGDFNVLKGRRENEVFLSKTKEYKVIGAIIKKFETIFCISINNSELLFLTELFLGSHSYNFNTSFFKHWVEMEFLVKKIIKDVGEVLGTNLSDDIVLYKGILNHLKPSLYRIKNEITLENKVSEEIEELYSDYFNAVKRSCQKYLEPHIGKSIPDEEIGYLTVHFKIALDKISSLNPPKNVLLVCSFGYGTSKLLAKQLNDEFNINILKILPYNEFVDMQHYSNIDLIVTTLNMKEKTNNIPIVELGPFISEENKRELIKLGVQRKDKKNSEVSVSKILKVISSYKKHQDEEKLIDNLREIIPVNIVDDRVNLKSLSSFLSVRNILFKESYPHWTDAVREAGRLLEDQNCTSSLYTQEMIEVIRKNGSYMVMEDSIAIPHANNNDSVYKTGFAMLYLKEPVEFPEGKMVNLIIPFSSLDKQEHSKALTDIIELIDKSFLEYLGKCSDGEEVLKFIIENLSRDNQ
ncbi:BglG family transcription antiterminator [uncultured Ilyobacter sp.]|uniref:BglG family transcription antiterminator n=1 Tax=uncultured Ilyobacter sp. TaxID=544433 RepID=UPI0029C8C2C6|nr:BglG family transcription antiterminator [uncultured Ilyobacter sp.]